MMSDLLEARVTTPSAKAGACMDARTATKSPELHIIQTAIVSNHVVSIHDGEAKT